MRPAAIFSSCASTSKRNCGLSFIGHLSFSPCQCSRQLKAPQTIADDPDNPACLGMLVSYESLNGALLHSKPLSLHSFQKWLHVACRERPIMAARANARGSHRTLHWSWQPEQAKAINKASRVEEDTLACFCNLMAFLNQKLKSMSSTVF
jgi:hypothetical protein